MTCTHCDKPVKARGLCVAHYTRWRRHGDPLVTTYMRGAPRVEQYWAKVDRRGPDECWPWLAHKSSKGYAQMANGRGGSMPAHRFGYELAHGPIPDGLTVDHTCHTVRCTLGNACPHRGCQNPAHLSAVTNDDNVARGNAWSAVNRRKTHCKNGHPLTDENIYHSPSYKGRRACRLCGRRRSREWEAREARKA